MFTVTGPTATAQNQTPDELREQRRQVQQDAAAKLGEIDTLNTSVDKLLEALDTLVQARDSAQQHVDNLERDLKHAQQQEVDTGQEIDKLETQMADTKQLLQESAIEAFRSHQGANSEHMAFSSNPWQHTRAETLRNFANRSTEDILDDFRRYGAELEAQQLKNRQTIARIERLRDEKLATRDELDTAIAKENEFIQGLENRLNRRLSEAQQLKDLDADLAAQIKADEQRLAAALAALAASRRPPPAIPIPADTKVELIPVQGIIVNVEIADNLQGFLEEMQEKGFTLQGSGYRDNTEQIRLRRQHCGTTDYDVYQKPASQCHPPTARPGFSQHELGLAIDFTHNGRLITNRDTELFRTMTQVAPNHGLKNLRSEPWHWSNTGT